MVFDWSKFKYKVVVIDDDPTGSQSVHGCLLLLQWDVESLLTGLNHPSPLLFILANTRSLAPQDASSRNKEIVSNLDAALKYLSIGRDSILLISRGDSTLRGHGFVEPLVLSDIFGPFDATVHCPAFLDGGRTTVNGLHLLHGQPVHTTPFAHDSLFSFSTSYLPDWLEEKSSGFINSRSVELITTSELDYACVNGVSFLVDRLRSFNNNVHVVLDALRESHLSIFSTAIYDLYREKRFLFRCSASLVKALGDPGPPLLTPYQLASLRRSTAHRSSPGLVLVGSFVPLTDSQLAYLLSQSQCVGLEVSVITIANLLESKSSASLLLDLHAQLLTKLQSILDSGLTPVVFSSRGQITFSSEYLARRFSREMARFMGHLVSSVASQLGYLITKGGLTTQTLLADCLVLPALQLEGQLLPGLSLVRPINGALQGLPILTFPGNLGSPGTLLESWQLLESCRSR